MIYLLFVLEILAFSLFLWLQCLSIYLQKGNLFVHILGLVLTAVLSAAFLFGCVRVYVRRLVSKTSEPPEKLRRSVILTLSPLLLLFLVLFSFVVFLRDVRPFMLILSFLGITGLQSVFLLRLKRQYRGKNLFFPSWILLRRKRLSGRQSAILVFFVSFFVYCLLASGLIVPAHPFTGDEPHYLIISESLIHDGDINLFDNYRDQDYLRFYPGVLDSHAYSGKLGERHQYSRHLPGLGVILIPAYVVGEAAGLSNSGMFVYVVRLTMCLLTALLSWMFFLTAREIVNRQSAALLSWIVFSFFSPVIFYSHLVYPEVPAALILLLIFRYVIYRKNSALAAFLLAGLGAGALPWLGVKYAALSFLVTAIIAVPLLKSRRKHVGKLVAFISPVLVSACLFLFYLWSLYGNVSPYSIYQGVSPGSGRQFASFFPPNVSGAIQAALGYLFDQRIGLFIFAPIYLLFVAGLILAARRTGKITSILLFLFIPYWLFCSLFPYWAGYCPPARQLLVVLWIAALFLAVLFAENRSRIARAVYAGGIALSSLVVYMGLKNPGILYQGDLAYASKSQGISGQLLSTLSSAFIDLTGVGPLLVGRDRFQWFPLVFWLLFLIGLTFGLARSVNPGKQGPAYDRLRFPAVGILIASTLLLGCQFFNIRLDDTAVFEDRGFEAIFQDNNHFGKELGGFWTKGNRKTVLLIRSSEPLSEINIRLTSPVPGKTYLQVDRFKSKVNRDSASGFEKSITVISPTGFPWKGRMLYSVQIKERHAFIPSQRSRQSEDTRSLGVFVEINIRSGSGSSR